MCLYNEFMIKNKIINIVIHIYFSHQIFIYFHFVHQRC